MIADPQILQAIAHYKACLRKSSERMLAHHDALDVALMEYQKFLEIHNYEIRKELDFQEEMRKAIRELEE